jgi:hypothetical protein
MLSSYLGERACKIFTDHWLQENDTILLLKKHKIAKQLIKNLVWISKMSIIYVPNDRLFTTSYNGLHKYYPYIWRVYSDNMIKSIIHTAVTVSGAHSQLSIK